MRQGALAGAAVVSDTGTVKAPCLKCGAMVAILPVKDDACASWCECSKCMLSIRYAGGVDELKKKLEEHATERSTHECAQMGRAGIVNEWR